MNKKIIMAIGAMAIAAVLGLIFSQTLSVSADPDLSEEEVKEMVEKQYAAETSTVELTSDGNNPVYEVELDIDGKAYKLTIDGNSGEVLQLDEKAILQAQDEDKADEQNHTDVAQSNKKDDTSLEMKEKIQREKLEDNKKDPVKAPKKEENKEAEKQTSEKESQEAQSNETESQEKESKPTEKEKKKESNERSIISTDRAIEIALSQFSGYVEDIELDDEDGRLIYEIEIESERGEADIEIDAYTGEVIVVEVDLDD